MRISVLIVALLTIICLSPVKAQHEVSVPDSLKQKMPVIEYKFNPKHLILPASLITIGAVGTAIDGMNDFQRCEEDPCGRLSGMGDAGMGFRLRPDGEGEA